MLATDERIEILSGVEMFAELSAETLAALADCLEEFDVTADETFIRQGERGDCLFIVVAGTVEIDIDGRVMDRLGPGRVAGELALLDPGARAASATAVEDTLLLRLAADDFGRFLTDYQDLSSSIIRYLVRFLRRRPSHRWIGPA